MSCITLDCEMLFLLARQLAKRQTNHNLINTWNHRDNITGTNQMKHTNLCTGQYYGKVVPQICFIYHNKQCRARIDHIELELLCREEQSVLIYELNVSSKHIHDH